MKRHRGLADLISLLSLLPFFNILGRSLLPEDSNWIMTLTFKIAVLAGDGIGPEVMAEAIAVLQRCAELEEFRLDLRESLVGGAAIDKTGNALPKETLSALRTERRNFVWFGGRSEVGAAATESATGARCSSAPEKTFQPLRQPEAGDLLAGAIPRHRRCGLTWFKGDSKSFASEN